MRAIETRYKGYRFRSRLEARWAVFFDALGIEWEYEPEGYELSDGERYLPDFELRNGPYRSLYEIKPHGSQSDKMDRLAADIDIYEEAGMTSFCETLCGEPWVVILQGLSESEGFVVCPNCGFISKGRLWNFGPDTYAFYCFHCDCRSRDFFQHKIAETGFHKGDTTLDWNAMHIYTDKLRNAANAARSARFEFGESGARI